MLRSIRDQCFRTTRPTLRSMSSAGPPMFPQGDEALSKQAWRKSIKEILAQLPPNSINEQSSAATAALTELDIYKQAGRISIFLSMPGAELQTSQIVSHALASGKDVFVPYITRKSPIMSMLRLQDDADFTSLQPDKWGIPSLDAASLTQRTNCFGYVGLDGTPAPESGKNYLDLVLMPAVAFDQDFDRLGHGKGYYDRFLNNYAKLTGKRPYLIGLALEEQIVHAPHKLPAESWDVKVDAILVGGEFRTRMADP